MELTKSELASYLDHTLLKPEATAGAIDRVIAEAIEIGAASVCVNPYWVSRVSEGLAGSGVETCTVVGFPLGATTTASKVAETVEALENGADEIDMVINVGELKAGNDDAVRADIAAVAKATHEAGKLLKVIIETCLLTGDEIRRASELTVAGGADFVKTSTGFSSGGAKAHDVAIMRETVGPDFGVKASGGIHSYNEAIEMIEAGASRLGVSASMAILDGAPDDKA
ncbi:deoxyribose-phosphate aldolase [Atopobiaceae bacterium 24-176]